MQLQLSARTLQRRLGEEGTSFDEVLDRVCHPFADQSLADPSLGLEESAEVLGYSDAGAFARAFKRWTDARRGMRGQSRNDGQPLEIHG